MGIWITLEHPNKSKLCNRYFKQLQENESAPAVNVVSIAHIVSFEIDKDKKTQINHIEVTFATSQMASDVLADISSLGKENALEVLLEGNILTAKIEGPSDNKVLFNKLAKIDNFPPHVVSAINYSIVLDDLISDIEETLQIASVALPERAALMKKETTAAKDSVPDKEAASYEMKGRSDSAPLDASESTMEIVLSKPEFLQQLEKLKILKSKLFEVKGVDGKELAESFMPIIKEIEEFFSSTSSAICNVEAEDQTQKTLNLNTGQSFTETESKLELDTPKRLESPKTDDEEILALLNFFGAVKNSHRSSPTPQHSRQVSTAHSGDATLSKSEMLSFAGIRTSRPSSVSHSREGSVPGLRPVSISGLPVPAAASPGMGKEQMLMFAGIPAPSPANSRKHAHTHTFSLDLGRKGSSAETPTSLDARQIIFSFGAGRNPYRATPTHSRHVSIVGKTVPMETRAAPASLVADASVPKA